MTHPARRLGENHLTIFLFHGVVRRDDHRVRNYTHKHLTRDLFVDIMRSLAAAGTPVAMDDVLRCGETGEPLPPRAFAVTFDDGFENNLSVAAPILEDLGVPATFYLTTGFIDGNRMSWIDRLEYALEEAASGALRLPWNDGAIAFESEDDRRRLLHQIRAHVKADAAFDREALIADVFAQCGLESIESNDDPLDLKLTWDQVRELAGHPLFTIGGHTHTHPTMSFLSDAALQEEIDTSLRLLRDRAGLQTAHYSYPEGLHYCFSEKVIDRLKGAGIRCCPTAIDGVNDRRFDLFHLRRIMVTPPPAGEPTPPKQAERMIGAMN